MQSTAQTGAGVSGSLGGLSGLTAGATVPLAYSLSNAGNASVSDPALPLLASLGLDEALGGDLILELLQCSCLLLLLLLKRNVLHACTK